MSKWKKILLGGTCLAGGAALFVWNGWEILTSLTQTGRGLPRQRRSAQGGHASRTAAKPLKPRSRGSR